MTSGQVQITFDCAEPAALATFWAAVLGYPPPDIDGTHAALRGLGHPEETLGDWYRIEDPHHHGPRLAFQRVPEPKTSKNRVHIDVKPLDRTLHEEVRRVLDVGATSLETITDEAGTFVVLQDPEGNEFCIG